MKATGKASIVAVVLVAAAAGFLGSAKPGHKLLYQVGPTSPNDNGCD